MRDIEIEELKQQIKTLKNSISELYARVEGVENPSTTLKFVGMGTVALDKNDGSKNISVHLHEQFPTLEGGLSPLHTTTTYSGVDAHGKPYNHSLQSNTTIKAVWAETPNRITAPNVRMGEQVEIYQVGDGDKFYWKETGRQKHLRRAERVMYAWNASGSSSDSGGAVLPNNHYTLEVDGKTGHITLQTSANNGEFCKYTLQVNTKKGNIIVADDKGLYFGMDSKASTLLLKTKEGGLVSVNKGDVILKGKQLVADFQKVSINGKTVFADEITTNSIKNKGTIATSENVTTPKLNNIPTESYL